MLVVLRCKSHKKQTVKPNSNEVRILKNSPTVQSLIAKVVPFSSVPATTTQTKDYFG
jgi:hypothetical protein